MVDSQALSFGIHQQSAHAALSLGVIMVDTYGLLNSIILRLVMQAMSHKLLSCGSLSMQWLYRL